MAVPDPFSFNARLDHSGRLTIDFDCPVRADATYRSEMHRVLGMFWGANEVQVLYRGTPFGSPLTIASSRSRVQS